MQLMQRLGTVFTDEYVDGYIELIKKHPGSCDNVWLPTMYGFPPLFKHREYAAFWCKAAKKFRNNGISVSLQLSNSIGHGQYMSARDCSGLVFEGSRVEKMVGHDGSVANYCFCWRGENFKKYLLETLSYYAKILPDCIWIDDDFRATNHDPVWFGCFCDDCMEKFNRQYGSDFTRKALVKEILHGDIKWRENYISFLREGLSQLMLEMGKTVHEISPDTAFGLQYCAHGAFTGYGYDFLFDAMKQATGKKPLSRPGGGAYNDHNPNDFLSKAVLINWQNSMLPDYVECKCPEIENLPFSALGKSPAGTAFETSYYLANGNTDMSYSMLMDLIEPFSWHENEFKLFSEHRKYWDRLCYYNGQTHQAGIQYFMSKEIWKKQLAPHEGIDVLSAEHFAEALPLLRDAIPVSYDRDDTSLIFLNPETARVISEKEFEFLLSKNVLTDGESINILAKRGFDLNVKTHQLCPDDILRVHEKFTDHPINPKFAETYQASFFVAGRGAVFALECDTGEAEILGIYEPNVSLPAFFENDEHPFGIAELVLKTKAGARWAVLGYCPWKGIMPIYKRDHYLDIADYISQNALPARLLSPVQAVLLPRRDKNGKTACVSITNCTVGKSGECELLIRNPAGESFTFMSQYGGEQMLSFRKKGDDYVVTVPSLDAWSVGTVFA